MQNKNDDKFTRVANKVIEDLSLKSSDKSVYMALSYYADNKTGECYPRRDTILKVSGVSDKTLRNSIKNLEIKGYISVSSRTINGKFSSNLYRLK